MVNVVIICNNQINIYIYSYSHQYVVNSLYNSLFISINKIMFRFKVTKFIDYLNICG